MNKILLQNKDKDMDTKSVDNMYDEPKFQPVAAASVVEPSQMDMSLISFDPEKQSEANMQPRGSIDPETFVPLYFDN